MHYANYLDLLDSFDISKQWDEVAQKNDAARDKTPKAAAGGDEDDDDFGSDDDDQDETEESDESEDHEDL